MKYIRFSANRKGLSDRDKRIIQNLPLVKQLVSRFPKGVLQRPGSEFDDLFNVGSIGLAKAVDRFDEGKGTQFSSFAVPYIRGEILHYLERDCFRYGIKVNREQFWDKNFRIPVLESDRPLGWDDNTTLLDQIESTDCGFVANESKEFAEWMLSHLSKKNRSILEGIYIQGLTQKEIARRLNASEVTITRRKREAVKQLQELMGRSA